MSLLLESGHFDSWATGNMPGFRLLKIKVKFLFNKVELHSTLKQSYFVSGRFQLYPHISRKKPRNTLVLIQKSIRIHVTECCRSLRILGSVSIIGGRLMQVSTVFYTNSLCLVYNRALQQRIRILLSFDKSMKPTTTTTTMSFIRRCTAYLLLRITRWPL